MIWGNDLELLVNSIQGYQKRDCFKRLKQYIQGNSISKVCVLYGLRRTGKTTLLLQAIQELSKAQFNQAVYLKGNPTITMAMINQDLKQLKDMGYKYIFIDEVTLIEDFIDSASLFSDIYASLGMKITLSGADSLGFYFTQKGELYDRSFMIHTTYIPFREWSRLLHIYSIDEYILYGGTLKAGELAFDEKDALLEDAPFRDDESTRRYIDTAIC